MYFIKYDPLKERLRNRAVTDSEALPYLVVFVALIALVGSLPMTAGYNLWDDISAFLSVGIAIGGIFYVYHENGGSRGYDLIQKYVVLGWVVIVRFLLACIPVVFILYTLGHMFDLIHSDSSGPYDTAIICLAQAILWQRIGRHVRDTHNISEQSHAPDAV